MFSFRGQSGGLSPDRPLAHKSPDLCCSCPPPVLSPVPCLFICDSQVGVWLLRPSPHHVRQPHRERTTDASELFCMKWQRKTIRPAFDLTSHYRIICYLEMCGSWRPRGGGVPGEVWVPPGGGGGAAGQRLSTAPATQAWLWPYRCPSGCWKLMGLGFSICVMGMRLLSSQSHREDRTKSFTEGTVSDWPTVRFNKCLLLFLEDMIVQGRF